MPNADARRNDEIRITRRRLRLFLRHLSICASFVIRHSSFVLRHSLHSYFVIPFTSIRSGAVRRWFWSLQGFRSTSPSLRSAAAPPSSCATTAPVPIHPDDTTTPRDVWPIATGGSPDKAVSPARRDRDAAPCCRCL